MTFNACTKDDAGHGVGTEDPAQVITLTVSNTNSSSTARAGRPMLGSEAKHSIENIYIVDASTKEVKYTKDITNWQSNSSEYDNGRTTDFVLETKLDDGNYRIFAVGYHSDSSYSSTDIKGALVSGSTFNENAVLSLATDGGAEEIFAGSTESIPVEKSKGFKQKVILNRQVQVYMSMPRMFPTSPMPRSCGLSDRTSTTALSSDSSTTQTCRTTVPTTVSQRP